MFTGKLSTNPSLGPLITVEVGGSDIALFSNCRSPKESPLFIPSQIRTAQPETTS